MYIDLIKPITNSDGVKVLLQGFEKAFEGYNAWRPVEGCLDFRFILGSLRVMCLPLPHRNMKKKKWHYQTKMFFKHRIVLWEPTEEETELPPGQHSWNFTFKLPLNLPPTLFFEDWVAIFYQVRAYVEPGTGKKQQAIISEKVNFDVFGGKE